MPAGLRGHTLTVSYFFLLARVPVDFPEPDFAFVLFVAVVFVVRPLVALLLALAAPLLAFVDFEAVVLVVLALAREVVFAFEVPALALVDFEAVVFAVVDFVLFAVEAFELPLFAFVDLAAVDFAVVVFAFAVERPFAVPAFAFVDLLAVDLLAERAFVAVVFVLLAVVRAIVLRLLQCNGSRIRKDGCNTRAPE